MTQHIGLADALARLGPTLAIDSSLGTAVAVSSGTEIVVAHEDDPLAHAEVIGMLIEQALAKAGLTADQVATVVVGIGPGPFTGLRVGIAAAHGFAAGIGVTPLGIVSHDAVAHEVCGERPELTDVVVVTDARRKELFVTRYGSPGESGIPVCLAEPRLEPATEFDAALHRETLHLARPERISAAALIELAALRTAAGLPFQPPQARYLRSPDVTLPGAPKRVSS